MINALNGVITEAGENHIVIDVSGVEYFLETSSKCSAFFAPSIAKGSVKVLTVFQVREDAMTLYGFKDKAERECFIQLLKLEPYIVFLFSCFFRFGYTVIQFLAYFSVLAVFVLVVCQLPCILCKYIQYIELKSFLVDKQVLVLAVYVNQLLSENFHLCQ